MARSGQKRSISQPATDRAYENKGLTCLILSGKVASSPRRGLLESLSFIGTSADAAGESACPARTLQPVICRAHSGAALAS